jgi:hypothetical protein
MYELTNYLPGFVKEGLRNGLINPQQAFNGSKYVKV